MNYKQVFEELIFKPGDKDLSSALRRIVQEQKVFYKNVEITHVITHHSQHYTLILKVETENNR